MVEAGEISVRIDARDLARLEKVSKQIDESVKSSTSKATSGKTPKDKTDFGALTSVFTKLLAQIAVITTVLNAILKPMRGTLEILSLAVDIFFRPFGMFLNALLRPLAISLLKMSINFSKFLASIGFGKQKNPQEQKDTADYGVVTGSIKSAVDQMFNPPSTPTPTTSTPNANTPNASMASLQSLQTQANASINELFVGTKYVQDVAKASNEHGKSWDQLIKEGRQRVSQLSTDVTKVLTDVGTSLGKAWEGILKWFDESLVTPLKTAFLSVLNSISKTLSEVWDKHILPTLTKIGTTIEDLGTSIKKVIDDAVQKAKDTINGIVNAAKKIATDAFDFATGKKSTSASGGGATGLLVPSDGMYQLHRGEEVIAKSNQNNSSSPVYNISINVDANVNSSIDIRSLAKQIRDELKSELARKTTYGSSSM